MFIFSIIVIFLIALILIPLKLKIKLVYINNYLNLEIFFFNFKIYSKTQKKNEKSEENTKDVQTPQEVKKEKKKKKKEKKSILKNIKLNFSGIINDLANNKYKPKLNFKFLLDYSLEDCSLTAQSFGYLNTFLALILSTLDQFVLVKFNDILINPLLNADFTINLELESIIYINLAQIISIVVLIIKNIKRKGGVPLRETYGE